MAGKTALPSLLKITILSALLFFPAVSGELSWLRTFIPLPAFYILATTGEPQGSTFITKSLFVAGLGALLLGSLPSFLLSVSFVPLAYVLARSVQNKESFLRAGTVGTVITTAIWVFGSFIYGMLEHVHPYRQLLEIIDVSLVTTFSMYQESTEITPETLAQIEMAFTRIRDIIPVILPAILLITVLSTVWINIVLGDMLLKKNHAGLSTWQPYSEWRLPDQLVWFVIISGIGLMLPLPLLNKICLNIVLVSCTLYFFQGLAVLSSLFNRWAVPWAFRLFVYALILIQAYGIIFLAIAGLIDVWFDLRKSKSDST